MADAPSSKDPPRPSLLRQRAMDVMYLLPSRRKIIDSFTRENIVNFLRNLALVVPLTVLIWVYAEREQLAVETGRIIPIDVKTSAPNRIVTLTAPSEKIIIAEMTGPRAQLDDVLSSIMRPGENDRISVNIDPSYAPGKTYTIPTESIASNPLFVSHGVNVYHCQPPMLTVRVDELVDHAGVPVIAPPSITNLDGPPVFDPPTVVFHGPQGALEKLESEGKLSVIANIAGRESLKTPGSHDEKKIPLIFPTNDTDVTFTPALVSATIKVKQSEDHYEYPTMTITIDAPYNYRYKVKLTGDPLLHNVNLTGPAEVIAALRKDDFKPKPVARLRITGEDRPDGTTHMRELEYDLPPGVRASAEDQRRTIEFQLVDPEK